MSREERRAYQRMNKGRDPLAPPPLPRQTQDRIERARQQRRRRGPASADAGWGGRWRLVTIVGFFIVTLLGLSFAWPGGMPFALIVGVIAGVVWVALAILFRLAQRRARQLGVEGRR